MAGSTEIDMLHGPLAMKLIKFAIPFALSSLLQQLFVSIDVAVVGRFASSEALAAVGANTFLINLLINLFVGISVGANVLISNHIGQGDERGIRHAVSTTAVLSLVSGGILFVIGPLISRPVLRLMDTPLNVLSDATLFLRIYFFCIPFLMIYNFGAAILRSKGDTKRPLYLLLIAGVINTGLNLVFVIIFHWSVAGVATATGIANAFSASGIVYLLLHEKGPLRLNIHKLKIYPTEMIRILQIGIPAGLQGMVFSLSNVFVQSAINGYGAAAIAGSSISQIFDSYCYCVLFAFSGTEVTFIGQNYGAAQVERCKRIFRLSLLFGCLFCFIANMLFIIGMDPLLSLFTGDAEVTKFARIRILHVLVFQSIAAFYEIPASALRGIGNSLEPALLTIFGTCVLRLVWIFLVTPILPGYAHLMIVYPISWTITSLLVMPAYLLQSPKLYRKAVKI